MKVMLKKMGHIVKLVNNAVKRQVNILKKTQTFSIKIFYAVVVGFITNDIIKDIQIQSIIKGGKIQNIKAHRKKIENK
jgi:hypothetical protein